MRLISKWAMVWMTVTSLALIGCGDSETSSDPGEGAVKSERKRQAKRLAKERLEKLQPKTAVKQQPQRAVKPV